MKNNKNNTNSNRNILAITAHPDDHISFAGTVFKLQEKGFTYNEVVLSEAEESGMIKEGKRLIKVDKQEQLEKRRQEFERASRLLQIREVFRLELPNFGIDYSKETMLRLVEIIRKIRPEICLIHSEKDYMRDHEKAYELSLEALRIVAISARLDLGKNFRVPQVLCFEGVAPIVPDLLVDITRYFDRKLELLKVYDSQMDSRSWQLSKSQAELRGYGRRTQYAEGFETTKKLPLYQDWG